MPRKTNRPKQDIAANGEGSTGEKPVRSAETVGLPQQRLRVIGLNADAPVKPTTIPGLDVSPKKTTSTSQSDVYFATRTRLLDFLLALMLCVGAFFSVALSYRGIGHSWDEALYLRPAASAGQWVWDFLQGKPGLLDPRAIDSAWGLQMTGEDPLHPEVAPLPKMVIGLGLTFLAGYNVPEMIAMRLPIAVVFGLTVALLYILGSRTYGRAGGFLGALMYWLMPRVFGHAHIAASETLFAFTTVFLVWAYLAGIQRGWMAVVGAFAYALAFDTKVTALFLPLPLLLWGQLYHRRDYGSNIFAIFVLSPLFAFALWPWLWYDPLVRLAEYVKFYASHQNTAVFYMGQMWGYIYGPPAPWHYPLVITGICVPVWSLLLIVAGALITLWQWRRRSVPMLYFLIAATIIGVCSLPRAPKYDGERLFFAAFPFLALMGGGAYGNLLNYVRTKSNLSLRSRKSLRLVIFLATVTCIGYNAWLLKLVHPDELNYFNALVGGARGAYEKGFETSYWGESVNEEVIDYLNELSQPGTKFKPLALNELVFLNYQGWGLLSDDATYVSALEPYDYYILQVRQGFFGNRERALHFGAQPLRVFSAQGVPKIEIFRGDALTTRSRVAERQRPTPVNDEMKIETSDDDRSLSSPSSVPESRFRKTSATQTTFTISLLGQTSSSEQMTSTPHNTTSVLLTTSSTISQKSEVGETSNPVSQTRLPSLSGPLTPTTSTAPLSQGVDDSHTTRSLSTRSQEE